MSINWLIQLTQKPLLIYLKFRYFSFNKEMINDIVLFHSYVEIMISSSATLTTWNKTQDRRHSRRLKQNIDLKECQLFTWLKRKKKQKIFEKKSYVWNNKCYKIVSLISAYNEIRHVLLYLMFLLLFSNLFFRFGIHLPSGFRLPQNDKVCALPGSDLVSRDVWNV